MKVALVYISSVFTNCYVFFEEGSGEAALIDPGGGDEAALSAVAEVLAENGLTLKHIFLTHGHYDHVGGVAAFRAAYPGAEVRLHPGDLGCSDRLRPTAALGPVTPWQDGDEVGVGPLRVKVLHTPGHTPGSVCLLCGEALFSGDTLFAGSMGRTDFEGGDEAAMMASLRRLNGLKGDYILYPGHMETSTLAEERRSNPWLRMAAAGA